MNSDLRSHRYSWNQCTDEEICSEHIPKDHYRPVKSDPEYLDNWVNKMDLLCKPQSEIGFLGSCFFIGIIISVAFAPKVSDEKGRLMILRASLFLQIVS